MNLKERIEQIVEEKLAVILDEDITSIQAAMLGIPPAPNPEAPVAPPEIPEKKTNQEPETNPDPTPGGVKLDSGMIVYPDGPLETKLMGYIVELLEENQYLYNSAHGYIQRLRERGVAPRPTKKNKRIAFTRIKEDLNL